MIPHSVTKNIFWLLLIQISNYILPLVVFPFIARYLGVSQFGLFTILVGVLSINLILTDYGFTLSATYFISKNRTNLTTINKYISNVFVIKLFLLILCIVGSIYYVFDMVGYYTLIILALTLFFQTYQPIWYFQGMEKMKEISIVVITSKLLYCLLILLFIPFFSTLDAVITCYLLGQTYLSLALMAILKKQGYKFYLPTYKNVFDELKSGFQFFLSRLSTSIYTALNVLIIGHFMGVASAAIYSSSEKIYQAGQNILSPISQAIYPYAIKTGNTKIILKIVSLILFPMCIGAYFLSFFSEDILTLLFGVEYISAVPFLNIFLILNIITFVSILFGFPMFGGLGVIQFANYSVWLGGIIQMFSLAYLYFFAEITILNIMYSLLITEICVLVYRVSMYLIVSRGGRC